MQIKYLISLFVVLIFMIGCGGNPKIKGKVVFSDDGSPVQQGVVSFVSDKGIGRSDIDENGYYVIGSEKKNDGIPKGKYRIYLTSTELFESAPQGGLPKLTYVIDRKYEDAKTSGLELDVQKSMTFNIEVDRYKK